MNNEDYQDDLLDDPDFDDLLDDQDADESSEKRIISDIVADRYQEPLRIDKFLMNRVEGATRNKLQQAMEEGWVLVNDQIVKPNYKVKPGDHIVVFDSRKAGTTDIIPEQMDLDIVYEDDDLMIINKKPGMVVHPGCGNYTGTLVNGLAHYLQTDETTLPRIGLVHRIDKDTSGLVAIAKNEHAMANLASQFKKHTVHRRYVALVWGDIKEDEGTVDIHIGRHPRLRKLMTTFHDGSSGKHAITHYKVLERFHYVTLVELKLETGRTHQIRVHMRSIGHPLFNDSTYGGDQIVKGTVYNRYKQFVDNCFKMLPRQALHAKELGFVHPATGQEMKFDSELPNDLSSVIEKWRTYVSGLHHTAKNQLED